MAYYCDHSVMLAQDADLLVHEATFSKVDTQLAVLPMHSTTVEAANVAKLANVSRLILTHLSARYQEDEEDNVINLIG